MVRPKRRLNGMMSDEKLDFSSRFEVGHNWAYNLVIEKSFGKGVTEDEFDLRPTKPWTSVTKHRIRDITKLFQALKSQVTILETRFKASGSDNIASIWNFKDGIGGNENLHPACVASLLYTVFLEAAKAEYDANILSLQAQLTGINILQYDVEEKNEMVLAILAQLKVKFKSPTYAEFLEAKKKNKALQILLV